MAYEKWPRWLLAVISGVLLSLAFPKADIGVLAWVAFIPLLYVVSTETLQRVFVYAWLQGFVFFVASLYWIGQTLHNFTSMPLWLTPGPLLLLAAIEALYGAIAVWAAVFVTFPVAWTALEWLRGNFPIGFPWSFLGYAAYRNLLLIQFVELTGVFGLSALIMFFNAVVFEVLSREGSPRRRIWALSALTGAVAGAMAFGMVRIHQLETEKPSGSLKVAMVQGDIPQNLKWDPSFRANSFAIYSRATEFAAHKGADLVIWPEAAATFVFQPDDAYPQELATDARYRALLLELARTVKEPILFGAPAFRQDGTGIAPVNRAYLVSGDGQVVAYYDKIQLVPFGEYVPLRPLLGGFVNKIAEGFGDFVPGEQQSLFDVKGARLGILICYESLFPNLTRKAVARGADVLVNITNDAWYGRSAAPYQLLAMAAMRAVENHVPMVRVANTGISAIIDPTGRIRARSDLFERTTRLATVSWLPRHTFYSEFGDWFPEACLALTLLGLGWALVRPRQGEHRPLETSSWVSLNGRH